MACCGSGCGSGCGGGYGGRGGYGGYGGGNNSVLVDTGAATKWTAFPGGCELVIPGPCLHPHCDPCVSCHCVCASECCMPCGGCCGSHGENGPGMVVKMCYPTYDVVAPPAWLCSNAHCGHASISCHDPCCGPC